MNQFVIAPVVPDGADWQRGRRLRQTPLTAVQCRIYDYIREHQQRTGETPLYREIAEQVGLTTPSAVHYQIERLAQLGVLRKPAGRVRAVQLIAIPVKAG